MKSFVVPARDPPRVESRYESVRRLVIKLAKTHFLKYGGNGYDFDEVLSSANVYFLRAYETFNAEKGGFVTWVHTVVSNGLMTDFRRRLAECRAETRRRELVRVPSEAKNEKAFSLSEFLGSLTEDGKLVVSLLVDYPMDLASLVGLKKTRGPIKAGLKVLLREKGWDNARIRECFDEISFAVRNRD